MNWRLAERDFQAIYNVTNPLNLTWRRFMTLLSTLSAPESHLLRFWIRENDADAIIKERHVNSQWWRKEFDRALGRPMRPEPRVMSIDTFMGGGDQL